MATTIMTTPHRHTQDASPFVSRRSTNPSPSPQMSPERRIQANKRFPSTPSPFHRPLNSARLDLHHVGSIPLSIGPAKRLALDQKRSRPQLMSRHSSYEITNKSKLPPVLPSAPRNEAASCVPATRPLELSPHDLNAPKAKRRSVEFPQPPLPKLVISSAEPKTLKSRPSGVTRLPAPVFTGGGREQTLRRASTSPGEIRSDWSDTMTRSSDRMTRLSLGEIDPKDDGARLFGDPTSSMPIRRPTITHHRTRSSDAKGTKRLSPPRFQEDVFDSSSSPQPPATPSFDVSPGHPLTYPPVSIVQHSPLRRRDTSIPFESIKTRSEGISDFSLPSERGIEKKRSAIGQTLPPKTLSSKVSRLSELLRPRDSSGIGNISFEGEHDENVGDASFTSMTSLGSPVKGSFHDDDETCKPFNFLDGLNGGASPGRDSRRLSFLSASRDEDIPMITPGVGPQPSSGWPMQASSSQTTVGKRDDDWDDDDGPKGTEDMDSILFATIHARQHGRGSLPSLGTGRLHIPDTPVKHAHAAPGRPSAAGHRPWHSTKKPATLPTHFDFATAAPRKSLPSKFTPKIARVGLVGSPVSEAGDFSPDADEARSPSPSLRTRASLNSFSTKPGLSGLGLGLPTSAAPRSSLSHQYHIQRSSPSDDEKTSLVGGIFAGLSQGRGAVQPAGLPGAGPGGDLLSGMGITKRRAELMKRTDSGAWSFVSDSSGDGFDGGFESNSGPPSPIHPMRRTSNLSNASSASRSSIPRKSVSFFETSPLQRKSMGGRSSIGRIALEVPPSPSLRLSGFESLLGDGASPITPTFPSFAPFQRRPSPLPSPPWGMDSDDEDETCNDDVVLDYGIREEPNHLEDDFICEEPLGQGSFAQAFRVTAKNSSQDGEPAKVFAVKRSKQFDGSKHRLRILEEYDILRHLATTTTPQRSRSMSLSQHSFSQGLSGRSGPAPPMEAPDVNVLHFVHGWEQDSRLYIQTELCELGNLQTFLNEFGAKFNRLDEARIWKIMSEVANGIMHIHHQNVIHLDLKPANIFITIEGRLRIGDFGMASRWPRPASFGDSSENLDREGDREYMAPEILNGRYGREADIFSFGMIMLECAGNIVVPSLGEPWHRLRNGDLSDVDLEGFSVTLIDLISQLMAPDPSQRPLIDQVCAHDIVLKCRALMIRTIEAVRRASVNLIATAAPSERSAARDAANVALFRASALGTEDESFIREVFSGMGGTPTSETDAMDLEP